MSDERSELAIALSKHHHRMMSAGIAYADVEGVRERAPDTWLGWYGYWGGRGRFYGDLGRAAADRGDDLTASDHLTRSALSFHFAQFMLYGHLDEKRHAQAAKVAAYRAAAVGFTPEATFFEVPSAAGPVPVVLRLPPGDRRPCVILIPGLEATKEELHGWEPYFLDRGIATAAIDGPGQGELAEIALDPDQYVAAVSGVLDRLATDPGLDPSRMAVVGVSLGGLLASMVAAREHRLAAAVEVGGTFDTESRWDRANALSRRGHQYVTKAESEEETRRIVSRWSMAGLAGQISCPFLVVHGELDTIVPLDQAEAYAKSVPGAELVVVPGGNHVCNNLAHLVRPQVADWLRRTMPAAGTQRRAGA